MEAQPCRTDGSISPRLFKACIFYQSYSIQLYEKDLFFDDKITTGKVKIPIGIVFIVSKDMK